MSTSQKPIHTRPVRYSIPLSLQNYGSTDTRLAKQMQNQPGPHQSYTQNKMGTRVIISPSLQQRRARVVVGSYISKRNLTDRLSRVMLLSRELTV